MRSLLKTGIFLVILALAASVITPQTLPAEETITVRLAGGDRGYPNPFTHHRRGPSAARMRYIFESLLERGEDGNIPWLAESWTIEEDAYVFKIRDDVYWHDGEPLTAHDVAFTFNYYQQHNPMSSADLVVDRDYLLSIEALSEKEVRFEVTRTKAPVLEMIGRMPIIPEHIWSDIDTPQEFTGPESSIATGPFTLEEYNREHGTYRYRAAEDYWGPTPMVDELLFVPVSDSILALRQGDIDLASIPADLVASFEADPRFTMKENPGYWGRRLRFNMEKRPELKDRLLRQAFAYAIDREALVERIARGAAVPGSLGILPPDHYWHHPDLPQYEYNPEKARDLLEKALGDSDQEGLHFELLLSDGEVRIGEMIRENLVDIGIEVTLISLDGSSRDDRLAEGNYELAVVGHGGWGGDPDYLRTRFYSPGEDWVGGIPGFENERIEQMIWEQLYEEDEEQRKELILTLQEEIAREVPEIPLLMSTGYRAFRHETYDGWRFVFDHHTLTHHKISFLDYDEVRELKNE